jgi:uncharacterized protein (DUF4415 family)
MNAKENASRPPFQDPDDAPELTDAWFAEADLHQGERLVRPGRPQAKNPKQAINIRLSAEVIAHFRKGGPGWQTRIDEALQRLVKNSSKISGKPPGSS